MTKQPIAEIIARAICVDKLPSHWDDYSGSALEVIAALEANGLAIVPVVPTEAMNRAGKAIDMIVLDGFDPPLELPNIPAVYRTMIQAAKDAR